MPAQATAQRRPGFSLVELLVVVAIILVLIALLLPSYSILDMFIRNRKCESNLKSIHSMFTAYANLNRGWYPYPVNEGWGRYFAGVRVSNDPWVGLTNMKQLFRCGATEAVFFCPFDTAAEDPADWRRATWKKPIEGRYWDGTKYVTTDCVYVGYRLVTYAGWFLGRPFERSMLADGRYPIGNVNGDGDLPLVADEMHMRMGSMEIMYGWYHGGGVNPGQGKYDGLFNSDCNTLFNAGYIVHKSAKDFDPKYPAFGTARTGYDCWWFALTR